VGQAHGKVATSFPSIIVHLWLTRMRDAVICTGLRALKPGTSALPSTRFQSTEAHEFRRKRRYFSNNCCPRRHHRSTDVQTEAESLSNALCTEGRSLAPLIAAPTIGRSAGQVDKGAAFWQWTKQMIEKLPVMGYAMATDDSGSTYRYTEVRRRSGRGFPAIMCPC
jgi:hypothetical protein